MEEPGKQSYAQQGHAAARLLNPSTVGVFPASLPPGCSRGLGMLLAASADPDCPDFQGLRAAASAMVSLPRCTSFPPSSY